MAEILVLNPSKRRGKRRTTKRRTASRRRNPVASLARRRGRRRNPIAALARRRPARRRNPIALRRSAVAGRRRRRNPIGMGRVSGSAIIKMLIQAGIGGAGAIAVDTAWAHGQAFLPSTVQTNPVKVGAGDAIKAVLTAALGILLNRPTKGLAAQAAAGALAVQARDVISKMAPQLAMRTAGVGFYSPAAVIPASARIGPNRALNNNGAGGMGAYLPPGATPLLNGSVRGGIGAYTRPGVTPLLNGRLPAQQREGFRR